jgi:hypothetical protein
VEFVDGNHVLANNTPLSYQQVGTEYPEWIVEIRDVYLAAISEIHLVGSDPARSSTWYRTPTSTVGWKYFPIPPGDQQTATFTSVAPWSGWYGVVVRHRTDAGNPLVWVNVKVS